MTAELRPVRSMLAWIWKRYHLPQARAGNGLQISFEMQRQIKSLWCWAAAASSVSFHLDGQEPVTQKEIVARTHGFDETQDIDDYWDLEGHIGDALALVGCFREQEDGSVSFRRVLRELENGYPVIGHIDWHDGSGHAIALSGCRIDVNDNRYFTVQDPDVDPDLWEREKPMNWVMKNYCNVPGEWVASYFIKSP